MYVIQSWSHSNKKLLTKDFKLQLLRLDKNIKFFTAKMLGLLQTSNWAFC